MPATRRRAQTPRYHIDKRASSLLTAASGAPHPDTMTTPQAADFLGVSVKFMEISRSKGLGPPFVRVTPRIVRYLKSELIAWLQERRDLHASDYAPPRRRS
jgi:predicted DNA-binding transcriptional regulator AlpA